MADRIFGITLVDGQNGMSVAFEAGSTRKLHNGFSLEGCGR